MSNVEELVGRIKELWDKAEMHRHEERVSRFVMRVSKLQAEAPEKEADALLAQLEDK